MRLFWTPKPRASIPADGHRIVEIGCVELMDHLPTGRTFQCYLNPERDIPIESQRVHGITDEFIADKPLFASVVDELFAFIGDAPLVIHNAGFDLKFLNAELRAPATHTAGLRARHRHDRHRQEQNPRRALFAGRIVQAFRHRSDRRAPSMARCSMPRCWRRSIWNWSAVGRRGSISPRLDAEAGSMGEMRAARVRPTPLPSRANAAEAEGHAAFVARELGDDAVWNWN